MLSCIVRSSYNYLASTLRGIGDTKAALYFLLLSLGYNLAAVWLLVAVLNLGVVGAALATAIAQLLSSVLCLIYIRKHRPFLQIGREDRKLDRTLVHLTSSYAAVAALQQSSLYLGKLIIQSAVNGISLISTAPISAFTAATRLDNFMQAFGISGCEAVAIFVAQNKGAGKQERTLQGFQLGAVMIIAAGLVFSVLMMLVPRPMSALFLGWTGDSTELCIEYLKIMGWLYFLCFVGYAFVGWYRGVGRMSITFVGTTLQIVIRVIGTYLLVDTMGLNAVALATGFGWGVIVLFHGAVFLLWLRGIWPKNGRLGLSQMASL